jgi:hypothetical protein
MNTCSGGSVVLELPISSIDMNYNIIGCFDYIKDIFKSDTTREYIIKLYKPNYIKIKWTVNTKDMDIGMDMGGSEKEALLLKKYKVSSRVKRGIDKIITDVYPNIDNIEYYRI